VLAIAAVFLEILLQHAEILAVSNWVHYGTGTMSARHGHFITWLTSQTII
jgi:hypothetical protein